MSMVYGNLYDKFDGSSLYNSWELRVRTNILAFNNLLDHAFIIITFFNNLYLLVTLYFIR